MGLTKKSMLLAMVMKKSLRYLQYIFPDLITNKIYQYLSYPVVRKLRESEEKVISLAVTEGVIYKDFSLMRYEWGSHNDKIAFLVHGWEGQTGNFASVINILLKNNFRVISFDAPSHGNSSKGKTNMFEFSSLLISHFIKEKPELVISHSFGSVNVARVLRLYPEINIKLWFLVTTPNNFKSRIKEMSTKFSLNHNVEKKLIALIENDAKENIDDLNMVNYCSNLPTVERAFIIHSKSDKILLIDGAREVSQSFKQSEMIELDNYGHYSILGSEELLSFLNIQLSK